MGKVSPAKRTHVTSVRATATANVYSPYTSSRKVNPPIRYVQAIGGGTYATGARAPHTPRLVPAQPRAIKTDPDPFITEADDVGANVDVFEVFEEPAFDPEEVGQHLMDHDDMLQTNESIRTFVDELNLGTINLRVMMDAVHQSNTDVERSLRLCLLGVAAKVSTSAPSTSAAITSPASAVAAVNSLFSKPGVRKFPTSNRTNGQESGEKRFVNTFTFLDMQVGDQLLSTMESKKSKLFLPGIRFNSILMAVQNRMARQFHRVSRYSKNLQQWEAFIQATYFAMLRSKDDIKRLTFRIRASTSDQDLLNVRSPGTADEQNTERLCEFILCLIARKNTMEEAEWISCIMELIGESLKKARRSTDEEMKRRNNQPTRPLDYYRRLLGEEIEYKYSDQLYEDSEDSDDDQYKQLQVT